MGILRKAVVGSLIIGAGALVASRNPKAVAKLKKALQTNAQKARRKLIAATAASKKTVRGTAKRSR